MAGELIVGYDGTDGARAALGTAAELAAQLGAGVVVAFAYEPPALGAEVADHRRLLEERGKALTDEALASLGGAGVEATAAVVGARPVEALLTLAAERQARMLVVGTGGEAPLMGVVLGATPYRLLHRSTVPVLVVPHLS
jgi:nucleotide-binding universal stress UspA family protein